MTFRIVTYNILAPSFVRADRYPNSSGEALEPRARRALLLQQLLAFDADVLALQEVEPEFYEAALEALGPDWRGAFETRRGKPDGCAVLTRAPMRSHAFVHHDLSGGRGRLSSLATIELEGRETGVVSTHLQWARQHTSAHPGVAQLGALLEALDPGLPWLICGDFNANSQSDVLQVAYDRGWALSCRTQRPWDTTNINGRRRKLDYVLYRPGEFAVQPGSMPGLERDTPMPSLEHPSDHLPVVVDVTG